MVQVSPSSRSREVVAFRELASQSAPAATRSLQARTPSCKKETPQPTLPGEPTETPQPTHLQPTLTGNAPGGKEETPRQPTLTGKEPTGKEEEPRQPTLASTCLSMWCSKTKPKRLLDWQPTGKEPIGNPPTKPNVFVDLVLENQTIDDQIKKLVAPMRILAPGPSPLEGLGAVGLGMDRDAVPLQAEIVTKLEHRGGYHYHRYDVYAVHAPFCCCWKGYYGEFTAEQGDSEGQVKVTYRGHMDPYWCCPCCTCILGSLLKSVLTGTGQAPA